MDMGIANVYWDDGKEYDIYTIIEPANPLSGQRLNSFIAFQVKSIGHRSPE